MISPLPQYHLPDLVTELDERPSPFPLLDRAFNAVERALAQLGVEDPASLRSPRPVEEALSANALPEGTLLVLSPGELRAAEVDVEETVKDERLGGAVYLSLPDADDLPTRARGLRELAAAPLSTGVLNRLLSHAIQSNPPPVRRSKRLKLLYATQKRDDRPRPVPVPEYLLFVNYSNLLTRTYERYLENTIRDKHPLTGLPIVFTIKSRKSHGGSNAESAGARVASKGGGRPKGKPKPKSDRDGGKHSAKRKSASDKDTKRTRPPSKKARSKSTGRGRPSAPPKGGRSSGRTKSGR